jgi:hypothetical protein
MKAAIGFLQCLDPAAAFDLGVAADLADHDDASVSGSSLNILMTSRWRCR